MTGFATALRSLIPQPEGARDEPGRISAVFHSPSSIRDSEGLYVNHDGSSWVYLQLPSGSGTDAAMSVERALTALLPAGGDREVHVARVSVPGPLELPAGTPGVVALPPVDAPIHYTFVGARLRVRPRRGDLRSDLHASAVRALGQEFPDLELTEPDRSTVQSALLSAGLIHMQHSARVALEWWFSFGASTPLLATERSDSISLDTGSRIELAAVSELGGSTSLSEVLAPAAPDSSSVSVRGWIDAGASAPALRDVSIVIGRRVVESRALLVEDRVSSDGLRLKALAHRQILALDETLPSSSVRTSPFLRQVLIRELLDAGLLGRGVAGDVRGLLLGFSHPDAVPVHVNPHLGTQPGPSRLMCLAGDVGTGTSTAAILLLAQARSQGARSTAVVRDPEVWVDAVDALRGRWVRWGALARRRGSLDPFVLLPPLTAARVLLGTLADALPAETFNAQERAAIIAMCEQAVTVQAKTTRVALSHLRDPALQSKLHNLFARTPALWPMYNPDPDDVVTSQLLHRTDVPVFYDVADAPLAGVNLVTRTVTALATDLVVLDLGDHWDSNPLDSDTLARATEDGRFLITAGTNIPAITGKEPAALCALTGFEDSARAREALTRSGAIPAEEAVRWLRDARDRADVPGFTPRLLLRDRSGRMSLVKLLGVPSWQA